MFDDKNVPAHDKVNICPLTIVKNESSLKIEVCPPEAGSSSLNQRTDSDYGTSLSDFPIKNVKTEVPDDNAPFLENKGSAGPGCSSHTAAVVKRELDISSTKLQPPDVYYNLQQHKTNPDYQKAPQTIEYIAESHELLVSVGERFSQQPDNHPVLQNPLRKLPRDRPPCQWRSNHEVACAGTCEPTTSHHSHDAQRIQIEWQPPHTDASANPTTSTMKLMAHSSGISSPILPQDAAHRDIKLSTSYECNYCHQMFLLKTKLISHMHVHTGVKPYLCKICGKGYSRRTHLRVHMRVHTGERPFECTFCGKTFTVNSSLVIHTRLHTGEKPFECKFCNKRFSDNSAVSSHMTVHTGERNAECKLCGKRYSKRSSLIVHMRVHSGEKPFECKLCSKSFSKSSSLSSHMRVHTKKPFECKVCGKRFKENSVLARHCCLRRDLKRRLSRSTSTTSRLR